MKPERFSSGNLVADDLAGQQVLRFNEAGAFQLRKLVQAHAFAPFFVASMKPERFSSGNKNETRRNQNTGLPLQ